MPTFVVHYVLGLAARHLHVSPRWNLPHPVQHAGALDVRGRAGADLGDALFPEVLLRDRDRRRRADRVVFDCCPFDFAQQLQQSNVIGASGAIYGLLLAYALYFPDRPIYMYFVFPIPAKIFVAIMGAIAFFSSLTESGGVANATHLGGLLVAYLFLKRPKIHPLVGIEIPLPEVEDQPRAQEVRRLLGRPVERLRSPRALNTLVLTYRISHPALRFLRFRLQLLGSAAA